MRLFYAIFPPPEVLERLIENQNLLRHHIERQGVRFASPQKLHLTLAFLGDDADPAEVAVRMCNFAPPTKDLRIQLGPMGAFPTPERPKTIWRAASSDDLTTWATALRSCLELSTEDYQGHITLARVSPGSKAVGRALAPLLSTPFPHCSWQPKSVDLVLTLSGGEYEVLHRQMIG